MTMMATTMTLTAKNLLAKKRDETLEASGAAIIVAAVMRQSS